MNIKYVHLEVVLFLELNKLILILYRSPCLSILHNILDTVTCSGFQEVTLNEYSCASDLMRKGS